jgi:NAD(P)H-dependent flavin oxidoreductase YrpB (nitropropane dioxygenase family)
VVEQDAGVLSTPFTELVGCEVPIQSAPMPGVAGPELVDACTGAGAMAMVGFPGLGAPAVAEALDRLVELAAGPVGLNVLMPFLDLDVVAEAAERAALVDFFNGPVDAELVALVHDHGALAGWQVGSVDDARAAEAAGCDVIVARGIEGGGHMYGERSLWTLLDEVVTAVRVPVLAAGGIGTAEHVALALDRGAAGVRVGTRLLATRESGAHPVYKQAVVAAGGDDTVLTDAFDVFWPDPEHRSARVLRSCLEAAAQLPEGEPVGTFVLGDGKRHSLPRYATPPPTPDFDGHVEAMALYAGRAADHVQGEEAAADVVRGLVP